MVTAITVKEKIQGLIDKSNNTTGNSDTTLTDAVDALVEGYGAGGGEAILGELTVTENGVYDEPVIGGGLEPISWDGVVGDKIVVPLGNFAYVKVSDTILTADDCNGCTLTASSGVSEVVGENAIAEVEGCVLAADMVVSVSDTAACLAALEIDFPETGTYFFYIPADGSGVRSVSFPSDPPTPADGWNKVTVNVACSGGGGFIDVPELPTENIDEGVCYRVTESKEPAVYVNRDNTVMELGVFLSALGMGVVYHFVDALPDAMSKLDTVTKTLPVYVLNATGQCYADMGYGAESIATGLFLGEDFGWVNDISEMTNPGVYALRPTTLLSYGLSTGENATIYGYNGSSWDELAVKEPLLASANFTDYAVLGVSDYGITLTDTTNKNITCLKIPDYVTAIGDYGVSNCVSLTSVIIPVSVIRFGEDAFGWCTNVNFTYMGTKEQWYAIDKHFGWRVGAGGSDEAIYIFCTDGTIVLDNDGNSTEI